MKLHSCENCGVVLDLDQITFPDPWRPDGVIEDTHAQWDGMDYRAKIPCPVCESPILNPDEVA